MVETMEREVVKVRRDNYNSDLIFCVSDLFCYIHVFANMKREILAFVLLLVVQLVYGKSLFIFLS